MASKALAVVAHDSKASWKINAAEAAVSTSVREEIDSAGQQLAKAADLKLPAAPLWFTPLPPFQDHKITASDGHPTSVDSVAVGKHHYGGLQLSSEPTTVAIPKAVIEYPLPGAQQTHEMAIVGENMLLVTQQSDSTLLKILLSSINGRPLSVARFLLGDLWDGLHGLCTSQTYPNQVWATVQFKSILVRIEPGLTMSSTPTIQQVITLPPSVYGPHRIAEYGSDLWFGCKDSCHVVRVNHLNPTSDYSVYPCSRHPIFIARHPTSLDMYASLDMSSKIWRLKMSSEKDKESNVPTEIDIPTLYGNTPVGLEVGTDGNVWFTLLGGSSGGQGTFARILSTGEFEWFRLTTPVADNAGLIHLAFDWNEHAKRVKKGESSNFHRLWLRSSTLVADTNKSVDALFSVLIDSKSARVCPTAQQSIVLPTQRSATHRIIPHRTGLFVSELAVSVLAHVTGTSAFHVEDVPGETTDVYSLFGLGQPHQSYTFQPELPQKQRQATFLAPSALPDLPTAFIHSSPKLGITKSSTTTSAKAASDNTSSRTGKRARTHAG